MIKDHSGNERGNRCHHYMGCSFQLAVMVILYAPSHIQGSTNTAFVIPAVEHWLEQEMAQ